MNKALESRTAILQSSNIYLVLYFRDLLPARSESGESGARRFQLKTGQYLRQADSEICKHHVLHESRQLPKYLKASFFISLK